MNKAKIKKVSKTGAQIGKKIVIEGTKTLLIGAFGIGLSKLISEGVGGLKNTTFNELMGIETDDEVTEESSKELEEA